MTPNTDHLERELERCQRISADRRDRLCQKAERVLEAEGAASLMRSALRDVVRALHASDYNAALLHATQALEDERASRGHTPR